MENQDFFFHAVFFPFFFFCIEINYFVSIKRRDVTLF
jgi:hypothetical protein